MVHLSQRPSGGLRAVGQVEDGAVGLGMTTYVSPVQSITPKQKVVLVNQLHTCLHGLLGPLGHRAHSAEALDLDHWCASVHAPYSAIAPPSECHC